jgi:hypothetical protein
MKTKRFDCVEMMHRGAEEIRKKIRRMTKKEQIEFWRERRNIYDGGKVRPKGKANTSRPCHNRERQQFPVFPTRLRPASMKLPYVIDKRPMFWLTSCKVF